MQITNCEVLENLDGFSALISVEGNLNICDNPELSRFCGLYPLLSEGVLAGDLEIRGNGENPTQQEITDGGPCNTTAVNQLEYGYVGTDLLVYPNPFNNRVVFEFVSPVETNVKIEVFDELGRLVKTIYNGPIEAKINYHIVFTPGARAGNTFFYRAIINGHVFSGKVANYK